MVNKPVKRGTSIAKPTTTARVLMKLRTNEREGMSSTKQPARISSNPILNARRMAALALLSRPERERAALGETEAASQAGGSVDNSVAEIPRIAPFTRLSISISPP
jgi:hypothetical protein